MSIIKQHKILKEQYNNTFNVGSKSKGKISNNEINNNKEVRLKIFSHSRSHTEYNYKDKNY
jgi:hypothetical protein